MQGYYYTICSMPHLSFTAAPPPLTSLTFLSLCAVELGRADMTLINSIKLLPPANSADTPQVVEYWYNGERQLRQELAMLRAAKLGREDFTPQYHVTANIFFKKIALQVMALESPLEAENLLDLSRWQILDELELEYDFGLPRLAIYFLKLQLLERRALFNQDAGQQLRRQIINRINLPERSVK